MAEDYIFMFPSQSAEEKTATAPYTDVAWDFSADKPQYLKGEPVTVTGQEAVRSWAYRALKTKRYAQIQNSWDYGNDLYLLIGQPWQKETKIAEAKRYVEECLSQNPFITGVSDFTADFKEDTVTVSFTLETVYDSFHMSLDFV